MFLGFYVIIPNIERTTEYLEGRAIAENFTAFLIKVSDKIPGKIC